MPALRRRRRILPRTARWDRESGSFLGIPGGAYHGPNRCTQNELLVSVGMTANKEGRPRKRIYEMTSLGVAQSRAAFALLVPATGRLQWES